MRRFLPSLYLEGLRKEPGKDGPLGATHSIRGPGQLLELVSHATLDEELLALIVDKQAREVLRRVLIDHYFPSKREAVLELCREEEAIGRREQYNETGDRDTAEHVAEPIRDAAFGGSSAGPMTTPALCAGKGGKGTSPLSLSQLSAFVKIPGQKATIRRHP